MFSRIFKPIIANRLIIPVRLTSDYAVVNFDREICDIQITGKLVKVNRYEDGKILLYIGALLSNSQIVTHKALILPIIHQAINLLNHYEFIGNDICIGGILNSAETNREEGKRYSFSIDKSLRKSTIMVKYAYYCQLPQPEETDAQNKTQTDSVDENQVSFIGHIESDIAKGNNHRAFTICIRRNRSGEERKYAKFCYHRVFVFDKLLFPLLERASDSRDQVFIRGELSYEMHAFSGCNVSTDVGSFITAHEIYCIRPDILDLL